MFIMGDLLSREKFSGTIKRIDKPLQALVQSKWKGDFQILRMGDRNEKEFTTTGWLVSTEGISSITSAL
jgi:hypothetical protein